MDEVPICVDLHVTVWIDADEENTAEDIATDVAMLIEQRWRVLECEVVQDDRTYQ